MTPHFEPVEPWKWLIDGLASAPPSVVAAVLTAGVVAFALPILIIRQSAARRTRLLVGCGLIILGLLAWAAVDHSWEKTPPLERTAFASAWLGRPAGFGLALLYVLPMGLAGLTAATYLGSGKPPRRVAAILALRAAAFLLVVVAILRPALAVPRGGDAGESVFYVVLDGSKSMTIQDESDRPRWEAMLKALHDAGPALDRLRKEQNVRVEFYRFADKLGPFSPDNPGEPDGPRTDIGGMLQALAQQNAGRAYAASALLSDGSNNGGQRNNCAACHSGPDKLLSDGSNNGGQRTDPFVEAGRWRRLGPIYTFGFGNKNTSNGQSNVAVGPPVAAPTVVPTKGKITVRASIEERGFAGQTVHVRLLLDNQEVKCQDVVLEHPQKEKSRDESRKQPIQVEMQCDAPDRAGEVKVTVKVDPLPGEKNLDDNQRDTLVTVVKGGLNVLLIDKERAWEPQLIYDALAADPRIQVKPLWIRGGTPSGGDAKSLFDFDKQKYDVIIIGDVTAGQLRALQPDVLDQIERQVNNGAGFLMIGGYASFGGDPNVPGTGDWKDTVIEKLLPVDLSVRGQVESRTLYGLIMLPTDDGLRLYSRVVGLSGGDMKAEMEAWKSMQNPYGLQGANRLAVAGGGSVVLAESEETDDKQQHYPLLVYRVYGGGRVLAFAGDTTNRWIHDDDSLRKHHRFWRQMILWLAKQEGDDQLRIVPDVRAIAAGDDLGFSLHLTSKNGQEIKDGSYIIEVTGPGGERKTVTATREGGEDRGVYRPEASGEYTIHATGVGKDADGADVRADATARFFAYEEDVEMADWSADEGFLKKLADEGRGEYHRGTAFADFLEHLPPAADRTKPKVDEKPDWSSASWSPFLAAYFLLFTGLLAAEWFLRRRWGMV